MFPVRVFSSNEVRVRLAYNFPLDPLFTKTMADYDLSLLMSRTLFEYDEARDAIKGLLNSWDFDSENGSYIFHIDENAKWSDGSKITSDQIVFNLRRPSLLESPFGKTISEIVNLDKITVLDKYQFLLPTVDKKPNKALFQRLSSIFFSLVHPADTKDNKVISNKYSCGPFVIKSVHSDEVELIPNQFFKPIENTLQEKRAKKIIIKKTDPNFSLDNFFKEETWENIVQTSTLMPEELAEKLKATSLPIWTRGHDRVALIKPIHGKNLLFKRSIIKYINFKKNILSPKGFPLQVKIADSLQPFGYPLHDSLELPSSVELVNKKNAVIKIITNKTISTSVLRRTITHLLSESKIKVIWEEVETNVFLSEMNNAKKYDFAVFSFGVADPEPATWMSLIVKNKFIEIGKSDSSEFNLILKDENKKNEIVRFRELLKKWYLRGSYAPLFHFSTLTIGHNYLDFRNIKALDETVDYSKVIFKK